MDAPEDRDLTLQRASADLLADFSTSMLKFLYLTPKAEEQNDETPRLVIRKSVRERKIHHLVKLVCWGPDCLVACRSRDDWCLSYSWSLFRNGHNY